MRKDNLTDPDLIRWSQLKRFSIRFVAWLIIYSLIGWLSDIPNKSEASTTTHIIILIFLSAFMALLIKKD